MLAYFLLFIAAGSTLFIQRNFPQERLTDKVVFEFNETFNSYSAATLRATSFGYSHAISGLFWLRFLQQTPPKKMGNEQVSWIYRDLDAVTDLDPDFGAAYEHGGVFLSVITEDKKGAEQIMLKGVKRFPLSWRLHAYLAYHYEFELGDLERAGQEFLAGAKLPGAPALVKVRAASYVNKKSGKEESIQFLRAMMEGAKPEIKIRLEEKIKKIKEGKDEK